MHHYTFITAVLGREVSEQDTMHIWNIFVTAKSLATYCKETQYNIMYNSGDMKNSVAHNLITSKTFRNKEPHINFLIVTPSSGELFTRCNSLRVESDRNLSIQAASILKC